MQARREPAKRLGLFRRFKKEKTVRFLQKKSGRFLSWDGHSSITWYRRQVGAAPLNPGGVVGGFLGDLNIVRMAFF